MNIKKTASKKSKRKKITLLILCILVLALIGGGVWFFLLRDTSSSDETWKDSATTDSKQTQDENAQQKQDFLDNANFSEDDQESGESNSSNTSSSNSNHKKSATISFSAQQEGDSVTIKTNLGRFSSGTCELKITSGSTSYSDKAEIIYQDQFSSCAGFSVPTSKLDKGTWNITLTAKNNQKTGTTNGKVNVK